MKIALSTLPHTWIIDIDGTLVKHNGHLTDGDRLLPGVQAFWATIPAGDIVVLMSARTETEREPTLAFLARQGLRYNHAIFGMPVGERILVNDSKPAGPKTAVAVNVPRDFGLSDLQIVCDPAL